MGKQKANYKQTPPIKVRRNTYDIIRFLSDKSGYSKAELMAQIFDNLFNVSCNFTEGLNVSFDYDCEPNAVKIIFDGKSNMISGEQKMPKEVLKEESKAKPLLRVKTKDSNGKFVELKQP
jgi:hypothetical protein